MNFLGKSDTELKNGYMDWKAQCAKMVDQHVQAINDYVEAGIDLDKAIEWVYDSTTLGSDYWQKVLERTN